MFLDIAIGIISAGVVTHGLDIDMTRGWVIAGIVFALFPDIDVYIHWGWGSLIIKAFGLKDRVWHREWIHYPIPYTIIGTFVVMLFGEGWALLFVMVTLLHFVHDSIGIGWGVPWFWPFSKRHFVFFYQYDLVRLHNRWQWVYG